MQGKCRKKICARAKPKNTLSPTSQNAFMKHALLLLYFPCLNFSFLFRRKSEIVREMSAFTTGKNGRATATFFEDFRESVFTRLSFPRKYKYGKYFPFLAPALSSPTGGLSPQTRL